MFCTVKGTIPHVKKMTTGRENSLADMCICVFKRLLILTFEF